MIHHVCEMNKDQQLVLKTSPIRTNAADDNDFDGVTGNSRATVFTIRDRFLLNYCSSLIA